MEEFLEEIWKIGTLVRLSLHHVCFSSGTQEKVLTKTHKQKLDCFILNRISNWSQKNLNYFKAPGRFPGLVG